MAPETLDDRVASVFVRVMRVAADRLNDDTRRGLLEEWNSLGHLMIVRALEEEFQLEISPEQALEMETIGDIKRFLGTVGFD